MTTLTYIPTIDAYKIEEEYLALAVEQIIHMYPSVLAGFLGCPYDAALDIQETMADGRYLRPDAIHIVDDSVYYLYKEETF